MAQLTTDELLFLLGQKEAENFALRRDLNEAVTELNNARELIHELASRPESAENKENT